MQVKTIGGDRLNSGKKMKVEMHGFERSTHDLSRVVRTSMSSGTVVPVFKEIGLPGDSWDMEIDMRILTEPTTGPVYGSMKAEVDVFMAPMRLYQGLMSMNLTEIGLSMEDVLLPQMTFNVPVLTHDELLAVGDIDNMQINPSCILKYLGISGLGIPDAASTPEISYQGLYLLAYWDFYKCYIANKQEKIGAVIHSTITGYNTNITAIVLYDDITTEGLPPTPGTATITIGAPNWNLDMTYAPPQQFDAVQILLTNGQWVNIEDMFTVNTNTGVSYTATYNWTQWGVQTLVSWRYKTGQALGTNIDVHTFPLENIDKMRKNILTWVNDTTPFQIFDQNLEPYQLLTESTGGQYSKMQSQEGLGLKAYNSDIFNNWLNTENINAINNSTQVQVTGGAFSINVLIMAKKLYDQENRIAMSGGTLDDWQEAVYDHERIKQATSPMYMGGLIKELVFDEVVSNSESAAGAAGGVQPLGTQAARGILAQGRTGGRVNIDVSEPSIIMAVASITPRIDYSQGNDWDTRLESIDDLHKPTMDQIGFQDLLTGKMAWWTINKNASDIWEEPSAGKQPAWLDYMTSFNKVYGNFAIESNEMFMVLTRRYIPNIVGTDITIEDLTTYIDPRKCNHIFAQTALDAQNFRVQIGFQVTARRKMSAKIMPNL